MFLLTTAISDRHGIPDPVFDKFLKKLDGQHQVSIPMEIDDEGYFDRQCPDDACESEFKVLLVDWDKMIGERAWCPFCGATAAKTQFNTSKQQEHIKRSVLAFAGQQLHTVLSDSAREFNRRQPRNSFVSMKMEVRSSTPVRSLPPAAAALMKTEITCVQCSCKSRVVGSAYFCPACGHNSASQTLAQTLDRVRNVVGLLDSLESTLDKDSIAQLRMVALEGGLSDLVTAFQHFAEGLYPKLPRPNSRLRRNIFQSLVDGSNAWVSAGGRSFTDIVGSQPLTRMQRFFQQRHLLEHCDGIIDQDYVDRANDASAAVGMRLVIKPDSVRSLADMVEALCSGLKVDAR